MNAILMLVAVLPVQFGGGYGDYGSYGDFGTSGYSSGYYGSPSNNYLFGGHHSGGYFGGSSSYGYYQPSYRYGYPYNPTANPIAYRYGYPWSYGYRPWPGYGYYGH